MIVSENKTSSIVYLQWAVLGLSIFSAFSLVPFFLPNILFNGALPALALLQVVASGTLVTSKAIYLPGIINEFTSLVSAFLVVLFSFLTFFGVKKKRQWSVDAWMTVVAVFLIGTIGTILEYFKALSYGDTYSSSSLVPAILNSLKYGVGKLVVVILMGFYLHRVTKTHLTLGKKSTSNLLRLLMWVFLILGVVSLYFVYQPNNFKENVQANKGARLESDVAQLHSLAEKYYRANNASYSGLTACYDDPTVTTCKGNITSSVISIKKDILEAFPAADALQIKDSKDTFCISQNLPSGGFDCMDTAGKFRTGITAKCGSAPIACLP